MPYKSYARKRKAGVRRKPRRALRRSNYGRRPTVSKTIKKYVKRAIHRQIENKNYRSYAANVAVPTGVTGTDPLFNINLIPQVAQGTDQDERVGNNIKCVNGMFRGYINLLPHSSETGNMPCWVRMWLVSYKVEHPQTAAMGNAYFNNFFEDGATTVGPQGTMLDMLFPVNKHQWVVHEERKFRLGTTSSSVDIGGAIGVQHDASNFSKQFRFNYGQYCKQTLEYKDSLSFPLNRNFFVLIQVVSADGSTGTNHIKAEIHYVNQFDYEDA